MRAFLRSYTVSGGMFFAVSAVECLVWCFTQLYSSDIHYIMLLSSYSVGILLFVRQWVKEKREVRRMLGESLLFMEDAKKVYRTSTERSEKTKALNESTKNLLAQIKEENGRG